MSTSKKILITGSEGFLGKHLSKKLTSQNYDVFCSTFDITKPGDIDNFLSQQKPFDCVIHLAGYSTVKVCEDRPNEAFEVNVVGTHNLINSLLKINNKFCFIFPSTGQIYSSSEEAAKETSLAEPKNFYSQTKLMAENIIQTYAKKYDFRSTILRLFTHAHKSQTVDFFLASVYQQLLNAKNESRKAQLRIGDVSLLRDFSAIQDLLEVFEVLIRLPSNSSHFQIYNICSSKPKKLSDMIGEIAHRLGVQFELNVDKSLFRSHDPKIILGDSTKFSKDYNWTAKRSQDVKSLIGAFLEDI